MFETKKIPVHVQSAQFTGDADKAYIKAKFYITPLKYGLACEVSEHVAEQLFFQSGGPSEFLPAQEMTSVDLNIGTIPAQNIEFYPHDTAGADGAGQMVANCKVGKLSAEKLFPDDPNWSLILEVHLPLDKHSLALIHQYYRKTAFISMEAQQPALLEAPKEPEIKGDEVESGQKLFCQLCNALANWLGNDQSAWCHSHVKGAVGISVRKIKYTGEAA